MGWTRSFSLIGLLFSISHVNTQYVIRRDFPSAIQNIPVTNFPVYGNQITPLALSNNNVALSNSPPAYNKEEVKAKLVNVLEKLKLANDVLSNLNTVFNNYVTPAAKLAKVTALTEMNAPVTTNFNTPLTRLRVPIVNEVPVGALRVARNLPITNLADPIIPRVSNVQVFGRGVNYQSVTGPGVPLSNVPRIPINNVPNVPLNRFLPTNAVPINVPGRYIYDGIAPWNNVQRIPIVKGVPIDSIRNIPISNTIPSVNYVQRPITNANIGRVPTTGVWNMPVDNIRNIPISNTIPSVNYVQRPRPITNLPIYNANTARVPTTAFGNIPIGNLINSPYTYVQRPSINLNNIGNMRINDLINLPFDRFTSLASNTLARLPRANTGISDCYYSCEQLPMASSGVNKITANVPIVPLNSLATLPAYKGLPVIKVSESVYRLTPVTP